MGLLETKGRLEGVADAIDLSAIVKSAARSTLESALSENGRANGAVAGAGGSRGVRGLARPGLLIAGGAAGVTAASAAVSAVRRKQEE